MESVSNSKDPPEVDKARPSTFSWEGLKLLGSAFKVWQYSPRDWAIWTLSGWQTGAMFLGLFKPIAGFFATKLPWVSPMFKAAWAKLAAATVAIVEVASP